MTQVKDNDDQIIIEQSLIISYFDIELVQHSKVIHIDTKSDHRFKVTTSTQRFRHVICDPAVVREFPVDLLRAMSASGDSTQPAKGSWSVTLHPYVYR